MASDNQNRILIIPWTPPSPQRRREIIQGEGERPSATRPMRTEARALVIDALRDADQALCDRLSAERGVKADTSMMNRFFRRIGVTVKKRPSSHASRTART